MIRKYIGNPGSGKTTALINAVLASGIPWNRILFTSFTKASVEEARSRAMAAGADSKDLDFFRTQHSLALRMAGLGKGEVVGDRIYTDFSKLYGYRLKRTRAGHDEVIQPSEHIDDFMLAAYDRSRSLGISIEEVMATSVELRAYVVPVKTFIQRYEDWKEKENLLDFHDMIEYSVKKKLVPHVELAIFDEMQDASPLLWKQADMIIKKSPNSYLAGDHNQAIYVFQGTRPELFRDYPADETIRLTKSWRVPAKIAAKALSVIRKNSSESQLHWDHSGAEGLLLAVPTLYHVAEGVKRHLAKGIHKTYFLLSRVSYKAVEARKWLMSMGIPCGGDENKRQIIEIFLRGPEVLTSLDLTALIDPLVPSYLLWKRGAKGKIEAELKTGHRPVKLSDLESIGATPALTKALTEKYVPAELKISAEEVRYYTRVHQDWGGRMDVIKCMTIHKAKGMEADIVFLLTGITKRIKKEEDMFNTESERCVWYVALTRAKEAVVFVENNDYKTPRTRII